MKVVENGKYHHDFNERFVISEMKIESIPPGRAEDLSCNLEMADWA
jgi:hypothetical protein